mgnify:FL=1
MILFSAIPMESNQLISFLPDDFIAYQDNDRFSSFFQLKPLQETLLFELSGEPASMSTGLNSPTTFTSTSLLDQSSCYPSNYSKDSLKFSRRLAREVNGLLHIEKNPLLRGFLKAGMDMLQSQLQICQVWLLSEEGLTHLMGTLMRQVWKDFSSSLSCSLNRKISKITKETWGKVFTHEGFWASISKPEKEFGLDKLVVYWDLEAQQAFEDFFKKTVFLVNKALVLTFLHMKLSKQQTFRENIEKFDNYLVLALVPEFYDYYNHRRGVFYTECCGSCKVCRSKTIDSEKGLTMVQKAIEASQMFETKIMNQEEPNYLAIISFLASLDISSVDEYLI